MRTMRQALDSAVDRAVVMASASDSTVVKRGSS